MENSIYIGISRQSALSREMDVIANNLANMNTPAYRAERMVFEEFLVKPQDSGPGYSFVQDVGQYRSQENGPIVQTGNQLDIALNSDGYFVVETPVGDRYTRHGRFQLDAEGFIVTVDGNKLLSDAGPMQVPAESSSIEINDDGSVSTDIGPLGKIRLVTFEDTGEPKRGANGLYTTEQEPQNVVDADFVQGSLEESNVIPILEMTRMIEVSNAYKSIQRILQQEDERLRGMVRRFGQAAA